MSIRMTCWSTNMSTRTMNTINIYTISPFRLEQYIDTGTGMSR